VGKYQRRSITRFDGQPSAPAHEQRGHHLALDRLAVEFLADQSGENASPLAVPHQHETAAVIVVGEIGSPCRKDVGICEFAAHWHRLPRKLGDQAGNRDLPINRREKPAARAETRELLHDGARQIPINREIGIACRFAGDGGVDIETVDRSVGIGVERLARHGAVLCDDRRVEFDCAGVGAARTASPMRGIAVIRHRRSFGCVRRCGVGANRRAAERGQ